MTREQLAHLRRRAHVHTDTCYGYYEPCGEHHQHSGPPAPESTWCGNRPLYCRQGEDRDLIALLAEYDRLVAEATSSVRPEEHQP